LGGGRVARVLAHRPASRAVHLRVDPTCEWVFTWLAEALLQPGADVALVIQGLDLDPGVGEPARVVGADDRRDRGLVLGRGRHRREGYGAGSRRKHATSANFARRPRPRGGGGLFGARLA